MALVEREGQIDWIVNGPTKAQRKEVVLTGREVGVVVDCTPAFGCASKDLCPPRAHRPDSFTRSEIFDDLRGLIL